MNLSVCLFLLRSVSSFLFLKSEFDGSYYPWTYSINRVARRTTCLYEICSKIAFWRCSFRKADAKVVLPLFPTKQIGKYFARIFVNKTNSLELKGDGSH